MNLFNAYKYLYYRIYSWQLWAWGETNQPHFNALLGVTVLVYFNIYILVIAIEVITGFSIIEQLNIDKLKVVIAMFSVGIINYFIFLYQDKYKQIAKQFKKESEIEKKRRLVWSWVYIIFTFACLFGCFFLLSLNLDK